jgi:drug/metabolite transporter (DMT)-like permease
MSGILGLTVVRYAAIVAGTVLWDVGAVLQKRVVDRLPPERLKVRDLLSSGAWMAGLAVTAAGWGAYVFGIDAVPVSAARTASGGSYVVLALFSLLFLRSPLALREWLAVLLVTAGIVALGLGEGSAGAASATAVSVPGILAGVASIAVLVAAVALLNGPGRRGARPFLKPMAAFAVLSGLLSSLGDLLMKVILALLRRPAPAAALAIPVSLAGAGLIAAYLSGFYMLSRAYQTGSMVGGVVISDFAARAGAILLGVLVLSEPLAGAGGSGVLRITGFAAVLAGSVLLGRFAGGRGTEARARAEGQ